MDDPGPAPAQDQRRAPSPHPRRAPDDTATIELAGTRTSRVRLIGRLVMLALTAVALYGLAPSLLAVFAEAPRLRDADPLWFGAMVAAESASFVCVWWLTRIAMPGVSWLVAATSQLAGNALSRLVPGGVAVGTALSWRMLATGGVTRGTASAGVAATSFISNGVLFAIPLVAVLGSIFGAPVPSSLSAVAWGGAFVFVALFALGFVLVRFDRPLELFGRLVERLAAPLYRRLHRDRPPTQASVVHQRDVVVDALGSRWEQALAAAVGKWLFDYLALVCALYAVGASPRLSLVLLAYGAAAVLAMIPITPGGLGFVEAGLTAMLALAGIPGEQALLATLAYRIASYWLPMPAGLVGWLWFRHHFPRSGAIEVA